MSNEKQKIKKYIRKFLKSKESKKVNKSSNHCEEDGENKAQSKLNLGISGDRKKNKKDSVQKDSGLYVKC